MGKTRDLFKKIRDTKGTFHAKMDAIKNRNGMDLTEAEDIKKRWQERESHKPKVTQKSVTKLGPEPKARLSGFSSRAYLTAPGAPVFTKSSQP